MAFRQRGRRRAPGAEILERIDGLTARNRAAPDPEIEEELVRLRFEAFAALAGTWRPKGEPRKVRDRFAGVTGPPEVSARELTVDALRSAIVHHGCLLVRGLIDRARADEIARGIDRVLDADLAFADGAPPRHDAPWYVPFDPHDDDDRRWCREAHSVAVVDSPRMLNEIIDLFDETGVGKVVAD